jgi:hypothetical protein
LEAAFETFDRWLESGTVEQARVEGLTRVLRICCEAKAGDRAWQYLERMRQVPFLLPIYEAAMAVFNVTQNEKLLKVCYLPVLAVVLTNRCRHVWNTFLKNLTLSPTSTLLSEFTIRPSKVASLAPCTMKG